MTKFNQDLELKREIERLKSKISGDMFADMELKDKIHNLEMRLNGTKPMNQEIDCINCSG